MSELARLEQVFLDALAVLSPELPRLVIVGGWCPYLYATYLWKKKIPNIPTTMDVDLGVTETGSRKFETTVYDRLKQMGDPFEGSARSSGGSCVEKTACPSAQARVISLSQRDYFCQSV